MITVEEIYERIQQRKRAGAVAPADTTMEDEATETKSQGHRNSWKPDTIENYTVPPFNLPNSMAKADFQKRYGILSKILAFINRAQHIRASGACTIMPIAVTAISNRVIFGSKMAVSRAINRMVDIGILEPFDETYRFHAPAPFDNENRAKRYKYYYENEQKFIEYCAKHKIVAYIPKNRIKIDQEKVDKVEKEYIEFEEKDVRFSSNLNLRMPLDVAPSEFEMYLLHCLFKNYPRLGFYMTKIDEINEKFYKHYPEFWIRFMPKFTWKTCKWGKKVVGISIRATNSYDNTPKEERAEILAQYGMSLGKDIRSSVPRLTKSLNEGEWIDESVDIYELINQEFEPEAPFTEKRREAIKELHMFIYFNTQSDKSIGRSVWRKMEREGVEQEDVYEVMSRLKAAIEKVEGPSYKSEIFYVESCVYVMILYDLLYAGHTAWLLYDAFYSRGDTDPEDFETMIAEGVKLQFRDFYQQDAIFLLRSAPKDDFQEEDEPKELPKVKK